MFWESLATTMWLMLAIFLWVAFFMVLFSVLGDLFRSDDLNGVVKTIWVILLIFLPFLGTFIYLIVRGSGMGERAAAAAKRQHALAVDYATHLVGGSGGPADQIEKAKNLLAAGAITQDEFNKLKAKALA